MPHLRIVFMGTPAFAVPSLDILWRHGYDIVGVVTATDKIGGRGRKELLQSPVKQYALEKGIRVLQPEKLKDPAFLADLHSLNANLQVVVAFRMLPEVVWSMPALGTFNLHGSLLPKYRGAAPINWAIINGETETGVTTFFLQHDIDTGDILFQERMPIGENDSAGEVHDRMMILGAETVLKTVRAIEQGKVHPAPQENALASHAPKIFHETCRIDFAQPVDQVHNFIRGLSPFPGAWTKLNGQELKILRTTVEHRPHSYPPGFVMAENRSTLKVAVMDGFLHILDLQLEGRRRMTVIDFLNGFFQEVNEKILLTE